MITHLGCLNLDWDQLILDIKDQIPAYVGPKHTADDNLSGIKEINSIWSKAGYAKVSEGGTVSWDMFLAGVNFDFAYAEKTAEFIGLDKVTSCWVSRIWPGHCAPIHWDVTDEDDDLNKDLDIPRWHCHMQTPQFGHIFIAEDQCFYNQPQGTTYQWSSRKLWHAGINCGLTPKYILNIW